MAEAHKFSNLDKALEVFPELSWAQDGDGKTYVDNSKTGERVPVEKGQYIVKVADRYEVEDEAPDNAKTAEKPAATDKEAKDERGAAATDQSNPQVAPESIGAPAGEPAAPAASVDASAAE